MAATEFQAAEQRRMFHTLDMLRGIAAIAVAGRHLNDRLLLWVPSSHLAVDLFFVLSGFVIAHAYEARLRTRLGFGAFMTMRVIRLYPLYILGTLLGAAILLLFLVVGEKPIDVPAMGLSLVLGTLFLPGVGPLATDRLAYPFNFPTWSLFWELVVNALYALVARWLGTRLLIAIIAIGAGLLILAAYLFEDLAGGADQKTFLQGGLRVVYSFFMGIAVYRIWASGRFAWLSIPPWVAALILVAIMVFRPASMAGLYDFAMALLVLPVLVLASTQEPGDRMRPLCTALGLVSYPLYVLHAPFTRFEFYVRARIGDSDLAVLGLEIGFLIAMVIAALLADRLFDRPVRKWLSQRLVRRPAPKPALS